MALCLFKDTQKSYYDVPPGEELICSIPFKVYKFNHRIKPRDIRRIKIVCCFSEFGCEIIGCMYCIPRLVRRFPGDYIIGVGWFGREYLYRHLLDEFWEIDESYMFLRDYCRAFHHKSRNLKSIERALREFGVVIPSASLGKYAVGNFCQTCGFFWQEWRVKQKKCFRCGSTLIVDSIFSNPQHYKKEARHIPPPSDEKINYFKNIVGDNCVGVFARNRATYGRNLPISFYVRLINLLREMGYNVVWLGEKQSTFPCPVDGIYDFSRSKFARDLENTLAVINNLRFTIQFWTASTRLAGIMGVPFLLFESPEQIYASYSGILAAQEGKRIELTTFGQKKIVVAHYKNVLDNQKQALDLVSRAIVEMENGDWKDIVGMVNDFDFVETIQSEYLEFLR